MDNLATLMDKKEYELVLKLTAGSHDPNSLFMRVSAFLITNRGEEALKVINDNRKILEIDLPYLMKIHIELLCILGKFAQAISELQYYKNLPYHSQEVEELLTSLDDYIKYEIELATKSKEENDDEILKGLNSGNFEETLNALEVANKVGIGNFLPSVKKILVEFPKQSVRSYALMALLSSNIDEELTFLSYRGLIKVNPSKLNKPFSNDTFAILQSKFYKDIKNQTVAQACNDTLSCYEIETYPDPISDNLDEFFAAIYFYSNLLINPDDSLTLKKYCNDNLLDYKSTNSIYLKICDFLKNY